MLILLLTYLLISNALSLRKDKSILFSRIVMVSLVSISFLAFNNLFVVSLDKGIGIYGGLFHVTAFTQSFNIFIFIISSIILTLTFFLARKMYLNKYYTLIACLSNIKFVYKQTKISNKIGQQFKTPSAPCRGLQPLHSSASNLITITLGGVVLIYTGDSSYLDYLYNLTLLYNFPDLSVILCGLNGTSIDIVDIPIQEISRFKPYDLADSLTPFYNGRDIVTNIGNRNFNYWGSTIPQLPYYCIMPIIGYIVNYISSFNLANGLKEFNAFFIEISQYTFNKCNTLKRSFSSSSFANLTVYMSGVTPSAPTANPPSKDEDDEQDEKDKNSKFKADFNKYTNYSTSKLQEESSHFQARINNSVRTIELNITHLLGILDTNRISYILNPDHSLSLDIPNHLSDSEVDSISSQIQNVSHIIQMWTGHINTLHSQALIVDEELSRRGIPTNISASLIQRLSELYTRYGNIIDKNNWLTR